MFIHSSLHERGGNRDAQSQNQKMQIIKPNAPGTVVGMDGTHCFGQAVQCDCWWRGSKPLLFIAWELPLMCLAWKILITNGRKVNKKGAFLKISFTSI